MPVNEPTLRIARDDSSVRARDVPRPHSIDWTFWRNAAGIPLAVLILVSVAIRLFELDLAVARLFHAQDGGHPWPGRIHPFCEFLYSYGPLPGIILGSTAVWAWILAARHNAFSTSTRIAGFLSLLLLVAPGLIVNLGLKNHWGRPRPSQIEAFGGPYQYAPLGVTGDGPSNGSFPSGHASIAFYLMAPGFLFIRRRRRLAAALLSTGIAAGVLMGGVRIVQGAHFLSDVIWSGAIVYFSGLLLSKLLRVDMLDPGQLSDLLQIIRQDSLSLFRRKTPASIPECDAVSPRDDRIAA